MGVLFLVLKSVCVRHIEKNATCLPLSVKIVFRYMNVRSIMDKISAVVRIDLLLYTTILNMVMYYFMSLKGKREPYSVVLFKRILLSTAFVSIVEAVSWSTNEYGNIGLIPYRYYSNAIFLSLIGLTAAFGVNYLDYKTFGDRLGCRKRIWIYLIPTYINIGFAVYNHFHRGFLFSVSDMNVYSRGIGVSLSSVILYLFTAIIVWNFYKQKRLLSGRVSQAISVFVFLPILGSMLQLLAYGTTLGMPAYTLASFLTYLLVEKDEMARDPLTQLYTRANLEGRLRYKLKTNEAFSVIMIDLNDFKTINDTYGHLVGDRVLKDVSDILIQHIGMTDMVCRYGGDEFFILLEEHNEVATQVIGEIDKSLEGYNRKKNQPYHLSLSYGYEYVVDPKTTQLEALIHRVDQMMYEDKMERKHG